MPISPVSSVSNAEKDLVWKSYYDRKPQRVPMILGTTPRVVLQDPDQNPQGWTFQQAAEDPEVHIQVALQHELFRRTVLNQYCDSPMGLPDVWEVGLNVHNVYDSAILGAPMEYLPDQVPDTAVFLNEENKLEIFEQDITKPLENPFIKDRLAFWHEMEKICHDLRFEGKPVRLLPWALNGTDGPVTVAMNLRGPDFMEDLLIDPSYADRLMRLIIDAAIHRREAFESLWGDRLPPTNAMADDSIAMLSVEMYKERILPLHRLYYESVPKDRPRAMHLCGDATRHFPLIHEALGICSFDTGFPVDHGALREQLGDDVEIHGGPEIGLIMNGSSDQVYERTKAILQSGIKRGGRFIMREANNLPPKAPLENLDAMYQATLEFGKYDV